MLEFIPGLAFLDKTTRFLSSCHSEWSIRNKAVAGYFVLCLAGVLLSWVTVFVMQ